MKEAKIVACAVIHNETDDTYLLGRRADGLPNADQWEFMGGKQEEVDNNSIQATTIREIWEEIHVHGTAGEVLFEVRHDYEDGRSVHLHFVEFQLARGFVINPQPKVYKEVGWFPMPQLLELNLSVGDRKFAETLQK